MAPDIESMLDDPELTRFAFETLGRKWSMPVLTLLRARASRFNEIRRSLDPITPKVLAAELRWLERHGLVLRQSAEVASGPDGYALSPAGSSLHDAFTELVSWIQCHDAELAAARSAYRERASPAEESACGIAVPSSKLIVRRWA